MRKPRKPSKEKRLEKFAHSQNISWMIGKIMEDIDGFRLDHAAQALNDVLMIIAEQGAHKKWRKEHPYQSIHT